jgi:hypothetical protein
MRGEVKTMSFQPQQIPHFAEFPTAVQEKLIIVPAYLKQIALAKRRAEELDGIDEHSPAALAFTDAREGEQFLIGWMSVHLMKICWDISLAVPDISIIHPKIQIVRNEQWKFVDVQIAEDLSDCLPDDLVVNSEVRVTPAVVPSVSTF